MGMGYGANFIDAVEEQTVKENCPTEFENFMGLVDKSELVLEEFARSAEINDLDSYGNEDVVKAYENLCEAFEKKTGLSLSLGHHDPEGGDRYDDVQGIYWSVGGVWGLTEAGKNMKGKVARKFFVVLG